MMSNAPSSRAVVGAQVTLMGMDGNLRLTRTNAFGYYRFFSVSGEACVVSVNHKRHSFEPQMVDLSGDVSGLDFTPIP